MYRARIIENVFEDHAAQVVLEGRMTVAEIRTYLKLDDEAKVFQNGVELGPSVVPDDGSITIKLVPGTFTTAMAVIGLVVAVSAVVVGIVALSNLDSTRFPDMKALQVSSSLRGSSNTARKGGRLPLLLGRHRVYPDAAALPFSSYKDDDQYLHQLFCFGYSDVSVDFSTLKIGETLVSGYDGCTYCDGTGDIYPSRVVENVYSIQLKNDGSASPVVRATASGCRTIQVGIMAPNGLYRYEGEERKAVSVGLKIEWRIPDGQWAVAVDEAVTGDLDHVRRTYSISPSGSSDGVYEVRVSRTTGESDSIQVCDKVYLDVIRSFVGVSGSTSPVSADGLRLVALKTKATDQLNGVVDGLNAMCTLKARTWDGVGTGASHWYRDATRNPASAILYLLTSSDANPEPVEDGLIDWASFEEFHSFCEGNGFHCDAWITGEFTVMQLCGYIASSNLAELVVECDSIGIRIEKAQSGVVQLFTPRNAWGFGMTRSFESRPSSLVVGFLDESKGYVEVERRVSVDDYGAISFDTVSQSDSDSLRIDSFGVTSADHAARLGAQKLKLLHSQTRTYSWKSDIEGIVCLPGDVVLIENDNFLLGLGEGRIKEVVREGASATGVVLDSKVRMLSEGSYGVTVRTAVGVFPSIPVETEEGEVFALRFKGGPPSGMGLSVGDLVSFGEYRKEAHRVLITEMTPDQNRSCTFKAVDYVENAYSPEPSVPAFDSGLSRYPDDGGSIGASFGWSVPRYEIHGTQGKDGASVEIQYSLGRSMDTPPLEDSQCYWNTLAMYWGSSKIVWRDWTESVPVPKDGEYLWMRVKVGDGPWRYSRLTGEHGVDGQDAKVFSIGCDHTAVDRNDRLEGAVVYKFTIVVQGYDNANPQLSINGEDKTEELEFDEDTGAFFYLHIMEKRNAQPITAILYDGTVEMDRTELQVVDSTMQETYMGVRDEAPTRFDETQSLLKGDWYVLRSTNVLYIWNGTSWEEKTVDSPGDFSYLSKVSIAMTDMIKLGTTDKTTATILGVFKYLAADQGFVKFLSVYNLMIDNPDGMSVDIRSRDEFGVPLASPVFDVRFKTKSVFRIDPATGNVYMGTGFFYQASDESIRSSSGKVVIDSDGQLIAENANLVNAVVNGIVNASSGLFKGSVDTPAFSSLPNTTGGTTVSYSCQYSDAEHQLRGVYSFWSTNVLSQGIPYECSLSANENVRYVIKAWSSNDPDFMFYDESMVLKEEIRASNYGTIAPRYKSTLSGKTFTISVTFGKGEIFKFKGLQQGKDGLAEGQVYYKMKDGEKQLFVV